MTKKELLETIDKKGEIAKIYDCVIDNIESQIKEGYFNKEYLNGKVE